ncbi:paraquat-inducible protein B [bacterium BMS3Abin14]|nr:paraquat-inducible protein B [bacterium BMS3Abin14]
MSKRASPRVIGVFVVGAILLIVVALLIFSSGGFLENRPKFVCFFNGSVKGLHVGAPVNFRGVRIGSVLDITLQIDAQQLTARIPVIIEIEPEKLTVIQGIRKVAPDPIDELVKNGLRAQLDMQSIVTGQLVVNLDLMPEKTARLIGTDMGVPEIPTVPAPFQEIVQKLERMPLDKIAGRISSSLAGIDRVVNAPELMDSIREIKGILIKVDKLVKEVDAGIVPAMDATGKTMKDAGILVRNVNDQVKPLAGEVTALTRSIDKLVEEVDAQISPLMKSARSAVESAHGTLNQATSTLTSIQDTTNGKTELAFELSRVLDELSRATRSLRVLTDSIAQRPDEFLHGRGKRRGE